MTNKPKTWVAISAATVPAPDEDDTHSPERRLAGIGLFVAEHGQSDRWRFKRYAFVAIANDPIELVLEAVADHLPPDATLIGWNVDKVLVPVLLDAARSTTSPMVGHYFAARLHRLLRGGVIDMALCRGGLAAPPLQQVVLDLGISTPIPDDVAMQTALADDDTEGLSRHLADEALALWKVFVRSAGPAGGDAEWATDAWLERRACINSVQGNRAD